MTLVKEVKSPTIQEILFSESITDKICLNLSLSRFLSGGLYITPIIVFLFFSLEISINMDSAFLKVRSFPFFKWTTDIDLDSSREAVDTVESCSLESVKHKKSCPQTISRNLQGTRS